MKRKDIYTFAGMYFLNLLSIQKLTISSLFLFSDAKNMATDVRNILLNIIKTKGNMSDTEAQQYIKKMETQKRYSADVWS